MACFPIHWCIPSGLISEPRSQILDVDQITRDYVWQEYTRKFSRLRRAFTRRSHYLVEVPMNYFTVDTVGQEPSTTGDGSGAKPSSSVVEMKTDFVNDTDAEQTYKFRLEKTRKSSMTVTLQKGFQISGKTNFTLGLPKVATASAGVSRLYTVTKTDTDVIEEAATFETNSDIRVSAFSTCHATVVMTEDHVSCDFKVWSRLSIPDKGVPVTVRRKRDRRAVFTYLLNRLDFVFDELKPIVEVKKVRAEEKDRHSYVVELVTTGVVQGVRMADQYISLSTTHLPRRARPDSDKDTPTVDGNQDSRPTGTCSQEAIARQRPESNSKQSKTETPTELGSPN